MRVVWAWCVLGATLGAAELESVTPGLGTVGTPLEVRLSGDVGKGKPKVWLTLADDAANKPKRTKLKVTAVVDDGGETVLSASFKATKTGAGIYDLHVKGKGLDEQVFEDAFTIVAPSLATVSPGSAAPKGEVTLAGSFLGGAAKKPKVTLAPAGGGKGKKAKVVGVDGDVGLTIKLPKLGAGLYDVTVANKVGEDTLIAALNVVGTGGPGGSSSLVTATLSSAIEPLAVTDFVAPDSPPHVAKAFSELGPDGPIAILTAGVQVGSFDSFGFSLTFRFDAGTTPTPFTIDATSLDTGFSIAASQSVGDVSWYFADGVPGTLTVTSATKQRITGIFEFVVPPGSVGPAASDLVMTNGTFDVEIVGG